ncbi:hypothetical protein CAT7_06603 [Carnobacterium sp. AT7]|nr:hypothetical protein CAT7_06603 [Carnobacterium sp. AT7]
MLFFTFFKQIEKLSVKWYAMKVVKTWFVDHPTKKN